MRYFINNENEDIPGDNPIGIELSDALEKIDMFVMNGENFIGFENEGGDSIQFSGIDDEWVIDIPTFKDGDYNDSKEADVDILHVKDIVTCFFNGMPIDDVILKSDAKYKK